MEKIFGFDSNAARDYYWENYGNKRNISIELRNEKMAMNSLIQGVRIEAIKNMDELPEIISFQQPFERIYERPIRKFFYAMGYEDISINFFSATTVIRIKTGQY